MQAVKDSFYMALRNRLTQVNPARTIGDAERPAVMVCENEKEDWLSTPEVFYLRWLGEGTVAADAVAAGWQSLRCEIAYRTGGSESASGEDRGRVLAQLDTELRAVLSPRSTGLKEYNSTPETDLGALILWTSPKFQESKDDSRGLQRAVETEIVWREDA